MSSTKINLKVANNPAAASKSNRGRKIVVLKLQPNLLKRFSHNQAQSRSQNIAITGHLNCSKPANSSPLALSTELPDVDMSASEDLSTTRSQSNESSWKTGFKRSVSVDGVTDKAKPKSKAKKTSRVDDLRTEEAVTNGTTTANGIGPAATATTGVNPGTSTSSSHHGSHRSNPRTNQGAINAQLRALDRSGAPCRKWAKTSFRLKSFTGVSWTVPSWKAPVRSSKFESDDVSGQYKQNSETTSMDASSTTSTVNGLDDTAFKKNDDKMTPTPLTSVTS